VGLALCLYPLVVEKSRGTEREPGGGREERRLPLLCSDSSPVVCVWRDPETAEEGLSAGDGMIMRCSSFLCCLVANFGGSR
jgi:hypothetical protein